MTNVLKTISPVAFALLTCSAPVFAQTDVEMRLSKIESQMRECSTSNARGTFGAKTADASPNIDGYGFYVTADAIVYQLQEDNSAYAIQVGGSGGPRHTFQSSFDWDWGFKVGLGYYAEHDNWQTGFEFTYLETQTSAHANAATGTTLWQSPSLVQLSDGADYDFSSASDHWKVHYYNLDWRIGRDFFVSKYLSFLPEFGIKSTWFYQDRDAKYQYISSEKVLNVHDNFVGVGPKADLKAKLYLGRNFAFIGGVDVALLFASNKTSYTQQNAAGVTLGSNHTNLISNSLKKNHVSPYLGLNIGFSYDTNFNEDAFNFGIKVAYEQQYYNKASRIMDNDVPSYRDVSFQGVDIGLTFSF